MRFLCSRKPVECGTASRVDQYVNDIWLAISHRLEAALQGPQQIARFLDRTFGRYAVIARKTGKIDRRIVDALANPAISNRAIAFLRHQFLLDFIRKIRT